MAAKLLGVLMLLVVPASSQSTKTTRGKVDLVELNHFLDDNGREVFRQVVFFDWSKEHKQFQVRAWRLIKHPSQLPKRQWKPAGYLVRWEEKSVIREVFAKSMRETWTQQDPERVNRKLLPENQRRPLFSEAESP